jgi:hypothetical protein
MPWWGVALVGVGSALLGGIVATYWIGIGMFRRM